MPKSYDPGQLSFDLDPLPAINVDELKDIWRVSLISEVTQRMWEAGVSTQRRIEFGKKCDHLPWDELVAELPNWVQVDHDLTIKKLPG
jgi:hypothetical protein